MADEGFKRKLTAILSADVIGYSRLMRDDEEATVRDIAAHRVLISEIIQQHHGRVVDSPGDNILAEFASVVDAVNGAIKIQQEIKRTNADTPQHRRMEFRIGINLGDVIEEEERIYGDGVNIAARVEGLAAGGGIAISGIVYDSIKDKISLGYHYLGEQEVKNIPEPVRIYRLLTEPADAGKLIGIVKRSSKAIWFGIAAAAVVVAFVLGIWQFYAHRPDIEPASMEKMAFALPDKPSIAVLPFDNLSGDKEQDPIADGLTEDIITSLSRVPDLFVIARNSTFTYKDKPVKVQQVAEELGVRYVLEGSVQRSGDNLRITAQLIDALKGNHLWAHRFDRRAENLFAMQDEITHQVLIELQVKLTVGDHARTVSRGTESLEAWLLRSQAYSLVTKYTQEHVLKARELYEKAAEIDPNFARAWAGIAWTYRIEARLGAWVMSRKEALAKALELAEHAIEIDPKEPLCYTVMADIYLIKGEHDRALAHAEKAVDLAPNYSTSIGVLAWLSFWAGDFQRCVDAIARMKRLNPHYPASYLGVEGVALLFLGRHDDATSTLKEAVRRQPTLWMAHARLVATYTDSDRMEKAKSAAAELLKTRPKFTVDSFMKTQPFKKKENKEWFRGLLLKAGLPENPPLPLPDKPSIAVLAFDNLSGDPEQEYFSDGISEEIINALSKTDQLFVIARNSSFTYKGKPVNVKQISRELGVRYVLEGSVRKSENRVRITAQLIDATSGHHLWSERYDRELNDIFAVQDEITMKIITALQVELTEGEQMIIWAKRYKRLDILLKAMEWLSLWRKGTEESLMRAGQVAQEVVDMAPELSVGYRQLGWYYYFLAFIGKSPRENLKKAYGFALKAISLDEADGSSYALLGSVYSWMREHEKAIATGKRAIELDPNGADVHMYLGWTLNFAGRPDEAIEYLNKAIRLNPSPPLDYLEGMGRSYLLKGNYEKAITEFKKALQLAPKSPPVHMYLAVTYSLLGREEEARASAEKALELAPFISVGLTAKIAPYKNQADLELILDAMRKAGFPEGT